MIGQTISHYKILEKLGEGGMGIVYKAQDTKLNRTVALKFLPHGLHANEAERARFLQEAQAASALNHPNICTIHDIAEEGDPKGAGQQFIVMELVDGKTLRELIPIQKMQAAIGYAIQIGEALQEAHSKGIVHRDVKTENIMVNSKNQVKVMDFGLAKLKGSLKLTKTSSTVGTLAYMAPERIQGGEVDARSDIFSFGVVLYEMLAGRTPFRGEHEAAMVYSIVNEEPTPIARFVPDASSELIHIIDRALEKEPGERYQSVAEMTIDLRRLRKETFHVVRIVSQEKIPKDQPPTKLAQRSSKKQILVIVGVVIALVSAFLILFLLMPSRPSGMNPVATTTTLQIPFTSIVNPSLSRDGSRMAFAARIMPNPFMIYFMNVTWGNPRPLAPGYGCAEISPDNSEVLYRSAPLGGKLGAYVISSDGGMGRKIVEPATGPRWRPDGKLIGYIKTPDESESRKLEFWTVRPEGTENRVEFIDTASPGGALAYCFDWSPDGKSVAWLRSYPGYGEIFVRELESGKERQLTAFKKQIVEMAWAQNGQILFCSNKGGNTNVWILPSNGGEAVQMTKGPGPDVCVRVSADCRSVIYLERRTPTYVWTADLAGTNARQVTFEDQMVETPQFSPDNSRISFTMKSSDMARPGSHIFSIKSDGTNRTQLTTREGWNNNATWSPDGRYMAYSFLNFGEPADSSRVYLIETSNSGIPRLIGNGMGAWWIDNERFVLLRAQPSWRSSVCSIRDPRPAEVSEDSTVCIPLRDGKRVFIWDMRKGGEGVWLKSTGGAYGELPKQILSSEYLSRVMPTVSLQYLLYLKTNGELWRISLPNGKQERLSDLFRGLNPNIGKIQLSSDDKKVVFLTSRADSRLVLIENPFE